MRPEELVEAFARGLTQGLLGARPVAATQKRQRKPRSIKHKVVPEAEQESLFPMPDFGRSEAGEIDPEQMTEALLRMEQEIQAQKPTHRVPSPPPKKEFPGDEQYPKMSADTYQPSREDDTEGQSTGIPWRA
jgi:hypothetical protein